MWHGENITRINALEPNLSLCHKNCIVTQTIILWLVVCMKNDVYTSSDNTTMDKSLPGRHMVKLQPLEEYGSLVPKYRQQRACLSHSGHTYWARLCSLWERPCALYSACLGQQLILMFRIGTSHLNAAC